MLVTVLLSGDTLRELRVARRVYRRLNEGSIPSWDAL